MSRLFGFAASLFLLGIVALACIGLKQEIQRYTPIDQTVRSIADVSRYPLEKNSTALDSSGNVFFEFRGTENRIYIAYEQIPKRVIQSFIATEDQDFLTHHGIDGKAIARALVTNLKGGGIQEGASTITQQLARNMFLNHDQTYDRKLKELLISYQIEKTLSKEKILELYVNTIYFQNGVYGIETASRYYLGKRASELTLGETALLASIPNNPSLYNPVTKLENTKKRQKWILDKMLEQKNIKHAEHAAAWQEKIEVQQNLPYRSFPGFAAYVRDEFQQLLADSRPELKGKALSKETERLIGEGIVIETALDPSLQAKAEQSLVNRLPYQEVEGAVAVVDHKQHEIIALSGGKKSNYTDFNRAYESRRQPGSAIKPLLVYTPYIDTFKASGGTLINAGPFCNNGYCPQNYGGAVYGRMPLSQALAFSVNTPAVRLLQTTGVKQSFNYLEPFHFGGISTNDHRLPAALGGFEFGFSPLELTSAYSTYASNGIYTAPHAIRSVKSRDGQVLYQWKKSSTPVWRPDTNEKMRALLSMVVSSGTARRASFAGSSYIGGKTGTTNNVNDLWFVGLTDRYTAGVWIGRDQPASIRFVEGIQPQIGIWRDVMSFAHNR
ncbi:transglycosylase domain-containing protein [Fictibacillus iocasae]|uniref:Transglycosylase domain-containing protein n=1 Tax=Fictibacillus iocasae TaxID=2715437 RepID=A0ABW2NUE3_9BACL